MPDIIYPLLMILIGSTLVWYFWNADSKEDDFGYGFGTRYFGYYFAMLGIILTFIEILDILPDNWVALISQITGIMICIAAVALAKWQHEVTKKMHKTPRLTAQERRKDHSQYAYLGLSFLFILGLSMFILNLG